MLQPPYITVMVYNGDHNFDLQNISPRTQRIQSSWLACSEANWSESTENLSKASVKFVFDFVAHRGHAWTVLDVQHEPGERFEIHLASRTSERTIDGVKWIQRKFGFLHFLFVGVATIEG